MNNTQKPEEPARRETGTRLPTIRRLLSGRMLRHGLFVAACLATLIALFYAVENWRGRRAWEKCRRELEARGEVIDWNAFIPAAVPDEQNIYKAPRMTEWFVKGAPAEAVSGAVSKAGKVEAPFSLAPRQGVQPGPVRVAEVLTVPSTEPLPLGEHDAVLRLDDPAAPVQAARLIRGRIGPCVEGVTGCTITAGPLDQPQPVYLVLQADKLPSAMALAEFLPRSPVPHNLVYGAYFPKYFQVEPAGSNSFVLSLTQPIYTAAEYLELSQRAVPNFDVLRKALDRPFARMDNDYQRPFERPMPNFVRLRSVAQMLSQRAQCYLLLGQPEAAWHELALVRDMCRMLEAKPGSDCATLVEAMIDVAIGGLYVNTVQDGLRLHAWRDPELAAMQKQLGDINFMPLVQRALQAERAGTFRTFETYTPAELQRLFATGRETQGFWGKLTNPLFLRAAIAPRGWMYQNMCAGTPKELGLLTSLDVTNNQVLPDNLKGVEEELIAFRARRSPYTVLARMALPNFVRATQVMARNQTLANEAYIACGLERYRLIHGQYPSTLEALVPQFAPKVPHDLLGGSPLKYRRLADDRFQLYSIGWNGKDDGGVVGKTASEGDWAW